MLRCINCRSSKFTEHSVVDGYSLIKCINCDLLQTKTSEKDRERYVKNKYNAKYADDYVQAVPKLSLRFAKQFSLIKKYKQVGALLDVGCGTGHFLKYLSNDHKKWKLFGVEPSDLLRKAAKRNSNINVKDGRLNSIPFADKYFDVITCYDVFEHDIELSKNINELNRVLKPGGLLFIQSPNYRSLMAYIVGKKWDWWCVPDHVVHFSYDFLTNFINRNGFSILESYTYEDTADFLSNIKGVYARNYFTKILFYAFLPFLLIIEKLGWLINLGGLNVVLAKKK